MAKKGVPKRDGSGKGARANRGRGGCKKPRGWEEEPVRHALAAHGVKTKGVMLARGSDVFSEKEIYGDETLVVLAQQTFEKKFPGFKLKRADAKWLLSQLWKQMKEDDVVDGWEAERDDAKESYRWELDDLKEEAKMIGVPYSTLKQPFNEWFLDNYGYEPKQKAYIESNKDSYYDALQAVVKESELDEYFDVFEEFVEEEKKTYRYVERLE